MGRPIREQVVGATYHVYSRCINKENLMEPDEIKDLMIIVIKETQEKFDFELNEFDILDNHFHFTIRIKNTTDTISKILQRIKSVFAKRYNKLNGRSGPFWNERFGSSIIEKAKNIVGYFIYLLFYTGYNSVRKGKVKDPRDYKYSSFNCYLDKNYKCQLKITIHEYFLSLGDTFEDCVKVFLEYEKLYLKKIFG
jgi:REP element-mobilizing transposase RayT